MKKGWREVKEMYQTIHLTSGLSNISFGVPVRKYRPGISYAGNERRDGKRNSSPDQKTYRVCLTL